jgi:hypothetical protein
MNDEALMTTDEKSKNAEMTKQYWAHSSDHSDFAYQTEAVRRRLIPSSLGIRHSSFSK